MWYDLHPLSYGMVVWYMFIAPLRMNLVLPLNGIRRVSDSRKTKKNRKTGFFFFYSVRVMPHSIHAYTSILTSGIMHGMDI